MAYTKHTWYTGEVITQGNMNAIEDQLEEASNKIDNINALDSIQDERMNDICGYVNYYDSAVNSASLNTSYINLTATRNNTRILVNGTTGQDGFLYFENGLTAGTYKFIYQAPNSYNFTTTIDIPQGGYLRILAPISDSGASVILVGESIETYNASKTRLETVTIRSGTTGTRIDPPPYSSVKAYVKLENDLGIYDRSSLTTSASGPMQLQNGHEYIFTIKLKQGTYKRKNISQHPFLRFLKNNTTSFSEVTYTTGSNFYQGRMLGDGGSYYIFLEIDSNMTINAAFDFTIEDETQGSILFPVETKTASTLSIAALSNTTYICGEVSSLSFTPCSTGICSVRFTSGSSVPVLTIPSTVMWLNGFDPSSLETNKVYELNVMDGIYGVAACWDPEVEEAVENS